MAVESPTADEIVSWTGLTQFVRGEDSAAFGEWLETLVPVAAAEVAVIVDAAAGDGTFDGDWSDRKTLLLRQAIAYYTAAAALVDPQLKVATGTNEPYIIEDSEAIAAVAERLRARGDDLAGLVTSGRKATPAAFRSRFRSSTFEGSAADRTPIDRNRLFDETDNVPSWDTVNG